VSGASGPGGHRVVAPELDPGVTVKGPASYFPSIERTYGQPMQHWLDLVVDEIDAGRAHMEAVAVLKEQHGMGHGHANAIVAYVRHHL